MARKPKPTASQTTISAVITLMGSDRRAAIAMNCDPSTIVKFRTGRRELKGTALAAARAVIRHPEDFEEIRRDIRAYAAREK